MLYVTYFKLLISLCFQIIRWVVFVINSFPGMSCRMTSLQIGLLLGASVCCIIFLGHAEAQAFGEQCLDKFKKGRDDFVLDTNESVKDGATFISSVKVERSNDCIRSCCKDPRCNVAFMEVSDEGMIKSCFLFDCLYKQSYVCRFVRKKGFQNYIIDSVYASDLATNGFPGKMGITLTHHNIDTRQIN